jgi:hypothetical protein
MSTDPMSVPETNRAADEEQERRTALNEYPEETERGFDDGREAESFDEADVERERGDDRERGDEETGYGTPVVATEETGYGEQTGYEAPADFQAENAGNAGSGVGVGTGVGSGYGTNGTNGDGVLDDERDDIVLGPEQNTDFRDRWREIQAEFIDDPQRAAKDADHLVAEITKVFVAQAEERRNRLASSWQHEGTHGTEELRLVMRHYRSLVDHMLD